MLPDKHIELLKTRIKDLENALFFNFSSSVLKLPVCVVKIKDVDEVGQVWFFVNKPSQSLAYFEHEFPAQLRFYKKGKAHRMQVSGKAIIIDDPEQLNFLPPGMDKVTGNNMVLVKVEISRVDYYEPMDIKKTNWFVTVKNAFYKWMYNEKPQYQPYGWQTDTAF